MILSEPNMKKKFIVLIGILVISLNVFSSAFAQSKKSTSELRIILIRHGEKPDDGDNLSCAGINRSLKLPAVLKGKFGVPDYIYVPTPNTGKKTKNARMLQTVTPLAAKYNLNINTNYSVDDAQDLARNITNASGTVLVVWEHKELAEIATALGIRNAPDWKANDFDSIWIITFKHGHASLAIDREGIVPANGCPF